MSQLILGLAVLLSATTSRAIDQEPRAATFDALSAKHRTDDRKPRALFRKQATPFEKVTFQAPTRTRPPANQPQRRIVCGLIVFEADPSLDPRMIIRAPASDAKIKRIKPPVCIE